MGLEQFIPLGNDAVALGQKIGSANSNVNGLGIAVTRIVEDARKKGLLQDEQDIKTQGAIDQATALEPFKDAASARATQQAINTEAGTGPLRTAEAVNLQEQTGPLKTAEAVNLEEQIGPLQTAEAVSLDEILGPKKQDRATQQAVDISDQTQQNKIEVSEKQAAEQGKQARLTAQAKADTEAKLNEGYEFEDPENPVTLTLKGFPPLIRVDKKVGDRFVKQWEDARAQGLFEKGAVNKKTQGIQTLTQLQEKDIAKRNLAERGAGTEEDPYVIESEAEIQSLAIPEGAVVQIGDQKFRVGPEN